MPQTPIPLCWSADTRTNLSVLQRASRVSGPKALWVHDGTFAAFQRPACCCAHGLCSLGFRGMVQCSREHNAEPSCHGSMPSFIMDTMNRAYFQCHIVIAHRFSRQTLGLLKYQSNADEEHSNEESVGPCPWPGILRHTVGAGAEVSL